MTAELSEDLQLANDVLESAIAFRGNSAQLFGDALNEVKAITSNGRRVYPPKTFPDIRHPYPDSSIRPEPEDRIMSGALSPAEAVAVKVLLEESSALAQSFGRSFDLSHKVSKTLGVRKGEWQSDIIEGIADFGAHVGIAAGVRENVHAGDGVKGKSRTWGDVIKAGWHEEYEESLKEDDMVIGENTAEAIVGYLTGEAEENIPRNPEGAKGEKEIQARIASRKKGAKLGKRLYLETLELASNELSTDVMLKSS